MSGSHTGVIRVGHQEIPFEIQCTHDLHKMSLAALLDEIKRRYNEAMNDAYRPRCQP